MDPISLLCSGDPAERSEAYRALLLNIYEDSASENKPIFSIPFWLTQKTEMKTNGVTQVSHEVRQNEESEWGKESDA